MEKIFSDKVDEKVGQVFGIKEMGGGNVPFYQMVGASKLPISKSEGGLWKERLSQAKKLMKDYEPEWNRNIDIYNNVVPKKDGVDVVTKKERLNTVGNAYENLIWSNTVGSLPELFAQNPKITITDLRRGDENSQDFTSLLQSLIDAIINKKGYNSIGLKIKAKKSILNALLTNRGIIKLGWTNKLESNEQVLKELAELVKELQDTDDVKKIKEIEGKIQSLEETIDLSSPSGPSLKVISPFNLYIDPTSYNEDASDANWIIERDWLPTSYIEAKYGRRDKDGKMKSVWSPSDDLPKVKVTDVDKKLDELSDNKDDDVTRILDENVAKHYNCTEVYWVYDKIKKRTLLYVSGKWDIPLWTWDDTLNLDNFFPYYNLSFYMNPKDSMADGEVNYYISIQNEINAINNEKAKVRARAFNSCIYNSRIIKKDDLDKFNSGAKGFIGFDLPVDVKLSDAISPMPTPSLNLPQIFDKNDLYSVMNKIASADAQTRGEEFKTNTTNGAIETYQMSKNVKTGEKRDLIEEWLASLCWGILQLCLQYFTKEDVAEYVGAEKAEGWISEPMNANQIRSSFSLQVVGETTVKPTSAVKKQQALQISQILGQFASSTPVVAVVMLRILSKAFDEASISKEDWDMIMSSIENMMQMQAAQVNQLNAQANAQQNQVPTQPDPNQQPNLQDIIAGATAGS